MNPPGPTTTEPFAPDAIYEFKIDTNGDAVADLAYRVQFRYEGSAQTATLRRVEREQAASTGDGGVTIIKGAPVSMGYEARVAEAEGHRFFAGWRSEPFFLDTEGALDNLQFTGDDFFADKDVCSVALEVPNSALGAKRVGLWHRTLDGTSGQWIQADRGGALPSQSIFLTGAEKGSYLAGRSSFRHRLRALTEHSGGYSPDEATRVARTLLPDILVFDTTRPASYPNNGRTLADDVMDIFLSILTNGKITRDNVEPHKDLLASFPYIGSPHAARSVEQVRGRTNIVLIPRYWQHHRLVVSAPSLCSHRAIGFGDNRNRRIRAMF